MFQSPRNSRSTISAIKTNLCGGWSKSGKFAPLNILKAFLGNNSVPINSVDFYFEQKGIASL
jgi:hypothetical protein